ncbi:HAD hydrolase-like protein [Lacticaseibacillus suibinensis]|uniref:HAD hydrolase-like protein n=1 Tax=Lacticaseibacillus suibinensis TaxID=2486011 RepID=UPI001944A1F5|nr:HAD hydrolase-like protein [Lacticaseibacillus suibinensis]
MLVNAIWDLDGTLYDTYPEMLKALVATLEHHGATVDASALLTQIKRGSIKATVGEMAPKLGVAAETLLAEYHALEAQTVMTAQPYPQAAAVVKAIQAAGGNNLLMTHRDNSAWALLHQAGLDEAFIGGVTAAMTFPRKPDPAAIKYLVKVHQLNPQRTAMIGDRKLDVIAGQRAGVKGVYFNVDCLNDAPMADVQIEQLNELLPLFHA